MVAPGKSQTREDASDAITRLIAAVTLRKDEHGLTQVRLGDRSDECRGCHLTENVF